MPHRPALSLPTLVIAGVVLSLGCLVGLVGVAAADPVARVTKAGVRKIATQVVKKQAKRLTVARARSADTLAGRGPGRYLDRVAMGAELAAIDVPGSNVQLVPPVSITVPQGVGFVRVTGNASFSGGDQDLFMFFSADGVCSSSTSVGSDLRQYSHTAEQTAVTVDGVLAVTPGVHTYRLCASGGGTMDAGRRVLVVETVAVGP